MEHDTLQNSSGMQEYGSEHEAFDIQQQEQLSAGVAELAENNADSTLSGEQYASSLSREQERTKARTVQELAQRFWVMFRSMWLSHVESEFIPESDDVESIDKVHIFLRKDRALYSAGEAPNFDYRRERAQLVFKLYSEIAKQISNGLHKQRSERLGSDFERMLYHFVHWAAIEGTVKFYKTEESKSVFKQSIQLLKDAKIPLKIHKEFDLLRLFLMQSSSL